MSSTVNNSPQRGAYSVTITGAAATGAGGQAAILNPEGVDLVIKSAFLAVKENSDGSTNLTIGTAASGTVAATSMLAATAMAAAAGNVYDLIAHGTAVGVVQTKWGSASYINVAASASAVGLEAILFVDYLRI